MKCTKILSGVPAAFLSVPVVQAANNIAPDFMLNLATGWAGLLPDVKK